MLALVSYLVFNISIFYYPTVVSDISILFIRQAAIYKIAQHSLNNSSHYGLY